MTDPRTNTGKLLVARHDWARNEVLAIEAEAAADCEREMLRQRDCDHSECLEREDAADERTTLHEVRGAALSVRTEQEALDFLDWCRYSMDAERFTRAYREDSE